MRAHPVGMILAGERVTCRADLRRVRAMSMMQEPSGDAGGRGSSPVQNIRRFGPGAVIAVATLLFVAQNQEATDFNFLWFTFNTGLWLMLLVSVLAGFAIGWFTTRRRWRRKVRRAD